jgi:hypothetical protein
MIFSEITNDFFKPFSMLIWYNLLINIASLFILTRIIKLKNNIDESFLFSIFTLNIVIYFSTAVLHKAELNLGAGFGLFAVFSMLRFRTTEISLHQMTFLFLAIAFGLIAAVWQTNLLGLIAMFGIILLIILVIYSVFRKSSFLSKLVFYDNINLIVPEKHQELIYDLSKRTGLRIQKVEILEIDFLKDATEIKIYY